MFISQEEKDAIKRDLTNLWNNVNTLFEGKRQMNNLFAKDSHGTVRPKVDMLADVVDKTYLDLANRITVNINDVLRQITELNKKIEKLEKK